MPVFRLHVGLLSGPKNLFFVPQREYIALTKLNVKFGTGELPYAKFYVYQGRHVGILPPNRQNLKVCPQNCTSRATRFHNFLLQNSQHLYASTRQLYVFNLVSFGGQTTKL